MPIFRNKDFFEHSTAREFDETHTPGEQAPYSGIYRCINCEQEIAANAIKGDRLPPQNHNQHNPRKGAILWQLVAKTK